MKPFLALFRLLAAVSDLLSRFTSFFVILAAAAAFWRPKAFLWVHGDAQSAILGVIMLAMGLTLSARDFAILAKSPVAMVVGASCLSGAAPAESPRTSCRSSAGAMWRTRSA